GGAHRTEGEACPLEVGERLCFRTGGDDKLAVELGVLLALHQRDRVAGTSAGLHESESSVPHQIQLLGGQPFHGCRVVRDGDELNLPPRRALQINAQGRKFSLQLGRRFVRNGGDSKDLLIGKDIRRDGERGRENPAAIHWYPASKLCSN